MKILCLINYVKNSVSGLNGSLHKGTMKFILNYYVAAAILAKKQRFQSFCISKFYHRCFNQNSNH